jgi:hypothetical protein
LRTVVIWRSFIDITHEAVHVMPAVGHEYTDCWCRPVEEVLEEEDGMRWVLVSHRSEDGSE